MQSVRKPGSESSEPHPSPRGLAPHSFQAGLLARRHPPPAPSHASVSHSGIVAGIVRLTAAGGCAGVSAFVRATGFPFHPFRSDGTRHLKFDVYCTRMIRQRKLRRTAAQNPYPRQGKSGHFPASAVSVGTGSALFGDAGRFKTCHLVEKIHRRQHQRIGQCRAGPLAEPQAQID